MKKVTETSKDKTVIEQAEAVAADTLKASPEASCRRHCSPTRHEARHARRTSERPPPRAIAWPVTSTAAPIAPTGRRMARRCGSSTPPRGPGPKPRLRPRSATAPCSSRRTGPLRGGRAESEEGVPNRLLLVGLRPRHPRRIGLGRYGQGRTQDETHRQDEPAQLRREEVARGEDRADPRRAVRRRDSSHRLRQRGRPERRRERGLALRERGRRGEGGSWRPCWAEAPADQQPSQRNAS